MLCASCLSFSRYFHLKWSILGSDQYYRLVHASASGFWAQINIVDRSHPTDRYYPFLMKPANRHYILCLNWSILDKNQYYPSVLIDYQSDLFHVRLLTRMIPTSRGQFWTQINPIDRYWLVDQISYVLRNRPRIIVFMQFPPQAVNSGHKSQLSIDIDLLIGIVFLVKEVRWPAIISRYSRLKWSIRGNDQYYRSILTRLFSYCETGQRPSYSRAMSPSN